MEELMHYGVKGMKWGHKRASSPWAEKAAIRTGNTINKAKRKKTKSTVIGNAVNNVNNKLSTNRFIGDSFNKTQAAVEKAKKQKRSRFIGDSVNKTKNAANTGSSSGNFISGSLNKTKAGVKKATKGSNFVGDAVGKTKDSVDRMNGTEGFIRGSLKKTNDVVKKAASNPTQKKKTTGSIVPKKSSWGSVKDSEKVKRQLAEINERWKKGGQAKRKLPKNPNLY